MTEQQQQQTPPPAPTATDAQNQMNALTADKGWVDRFLTADPAALKEFRALTGAIVDGGSAADVVASIMEGKAPDFGNSEQRQMASYVDHVRELGISDGVTKQFLSGQKVSPAEYQAVANLKRELMGSAEFTKAYLGGDVKAKQRMTTINQVLLNGVKVEGA
ncbi:hypothetical protein V1283_003303 [Bradyrhizobium sp. AZCC 2262]|uniref:hypothetical protein n=1 Tax=Bradyrhizobium sp. AZCC 2262 TaxID=3117022 RepID=UPI002FF13FE6